VRDIFLPWYNSYRFCIQNIQRWEKRSGKNFLFNPETKYAVFKNKKANIMDRYIVTACQDMIKQVRHEMDNYRLYNVLRHILSFLENLTNWYVRLNRPRMKGESNSADDQFTSLNILFEVLLRTTQLISPVTPFLSEHIYFNLRNGLTEKDKTDSIHFTEMPTFDEKLIDQHTKVMIENMQDAIETGRVVRDGLKLSSKYPLQKVKLIDADQAVLDGFKKIESYIKEELNCMEVEYETDEDKYLQYTAEPERQACGKALGKKFNNDFKTELSKLTNDQVKKFMKTGKIKVNGCDVTEEMLKINKDFSKKVLDDHLWGQKASSKSNVMLNIEFNDEMLGMGRSREVTNRVQRLRKTTGISIEDQIEIYYEFAGQANENSLLGQVMKKHGAKIETTTKMPLAHK